MITGKNEELVKRFAGNPIITAKDMPYSTNSVMNPGVARFKNTYVMVLRVEAKTGLNHLTLAFSEDGYHFKIQDRPAMIPSDKEPFKTYEELGVSDPRLTQIGDSYYLCYSAWSRYGVRVGIAKTDDFQTFSRISLSTEIDNHDGALFPEKINGLYVRLDRPMGLTMPYYTWISYSPDLVYWGNSKVLFETRPACWDMTKVGAGAPPIRTEKGWLELYHGVKENCNSYVYRLGCVLLDLGDPAKVVGRSKNYILSPEEPYECIGNVPNVVFACGAVPDYDRAEVKIYYGAADQCICAATAKIDDLVDSCFE